MPRSEMYMDVSWPNNGRDSAAPDRIEHAYSSGEEDTQMGKQSYAHLQGKLQPAHLGSQSMSPAKE